MNTNIFNIDYGKLVKLLLPTMLRKPLMVAWLNALVWPVQQLYSSFKKNRKADLYRLKITPQVVYLQRLLNDRYDVALRRIKIIDSIYHDPLYIFTKAENKPLWVKMKSENVPQWLWLKSETSLDPADFTIQIPSDINYQLPELQGIIDSYKLAGKTYSIQTI
ncbi:MAG: hypothetical protein EPN37_04565 [Chitinophagaceae bacterium]|nr:MAG: hypothetical protein EPN37_04565 [Chitinophagaceae bacterium]